MVSATVRAVVLFFLLLAGSAAWACSCGGPNPICSVYFGTPTIFRGIVVERTLISPPLQTVKDRDGTTQQIRSGGKYKVRFAVSETLRGEGVQELTVYTNEQSSACGFDFREGAEYVVYTYANQEGNELWTSKCSTTHTVTGSGVDSDLEWMRGLAKAPSGSRIFGSVMLAREGPMAGAKVSIRGAVNRELVPDEKGKYEANGLPAGEYTVSGSVPAGFWVPPDRKVRLSDKGCAEVDWYVTYDGHIRGRVTDVDGTPIPNISVNVNRLDSNSFSGVALVESATTGEDGRWEVKWIGPGKYFVEANSLGSSLKVPYPKVFFPSSETLEGSTPVLVGVSEFVSGIDLVLPRAMKTVSVKARVVDTEGKPMAGVTVYGYEVKNIPSSFPMSALTDEEGRATLAVFAGQEYYVTALLNGVHQHCGGPVRLMAIEGVDAGTIRIEHPWGNCLAQLNPKFVGPSR